ncbi:MAG: PAS domain S-box protein [Paludibacter sp.]|nr:PAS domain S-box protein [Paludibacter sp.]
MNKKPLQDKDNNESDFQFEDLFQVHEIQEMQNSFSAATGVASIITYPDGKPITSSSNFCRLCNDIIRKTEKGRINCMKSDALIGGNTETGYTINCCLSGGLWDAGVPIVVGGKHIANWLIGQVRNEAQDDESMLKYAVEIGADIEEYKKALTEVPLMSKEKFKSTTELLTLLTKQLCEKAYANYLLKQEVKQHEKSIQLLETAESSASITLHSIGDAVIVANTNGCITRINLVAEQLSGWRTDEAIGKPLSDVLNIINTDTISDLAGMVMTTGSIVEMNGLIKLISKSGEEFMISSSLAPIKNAVGTITGVVIVISDITKKVETENRLRESERIKSVVLSNLPGIAYRCLFNKEWTMEFISEGCYSLTGYKAEELLYNKRMSYNDIIAPEFRDHLWQCWIHAADTHTHITEEYKIITADNKVKWVWEQGIPIYNEAGEVEALEGLIIDIDERKTLEKRLFDERTLMRTLIDNIPDSIYAKDAQLRKTLANKAEITFAGLQSENEIIGKTDFDLYPPEVAEKLYNDDIEVMNTGKALINIEEVIIDKNGNKRWLLTSKIPLRNNDDEITGLVGIGRDITIRTKTLEKLKESEQKYRNIFENVQDVFYQMDLTGKIIDISPSVQSFTGYERDQMLGQSLFDLLFTPVDKNKFMTRLLKFGTLTDFELELMIQKNIKKYVSINTAIINDDNGLPHHIDGTIRDITLQKTTEKALRESETKFRNYIDFAPHAIFVSDETGKYIEVNQAATTITGYTKEELCSIDPVVIIKEKNHDKFRMHLQRCRENGVATDEFEVTRKDNTLIYCSVESVRLSGNRTLGFVADITNRKLADEALRKSESLYRSILETSPDVIAIVDLEGYVRMVSPIATKLYGGHSDNDLIGRNIFDIIAPQERQKAITNTNLMFDKYLGSVEYQISRYDGTIFDAEVNGNVIWSENNIPTGFIYIIRDITERKKVALSLQQSREELKNFSTHLQNVREEERKLLAREIHDDLGQILVAIKMELGMLGLKVNRTLKDEQEIAGQFKRLSGLVDTTIKTTRRIMTGLRSEELELLGIVEALRTFILNFEALYHIKCEFITDNNDFVLDPQRSVAVYRIVQESFSNIAKHAQASHVVVKMKTHNKRLSIEITDDGIGFDINKKAKMDSYGHIGMRERTLLLDGEINFTTGHEKGTTVSLTLPIE